MQGHKTNAQPTGTIETISPSAKLRNYVGRRAIERKKTRKLKYAIVSVFV